MKRKYGLAVAALLLILLSSLATPRLSHAIQTSAIALSLEAGFEGYFRSGHWLPILVRVSNTGPDVSGVLRVNAGDALSIASDTYATTVDLPTQSSKQIFLYLPLSEIVQEVRVELATADQILASETRSVRVAREADMLFAVITESPRGGIDLKSVRSGIGEAFQANWRMENIPRSAEAMRGLDALVITDADSGTLSIEQRQALDEWVLSGGHLIVTGGPNWQKTSAGVLPLLPLQPNNTTTLTSLPSLASFAGRLNTRLEAPVGTPIAVATGILMPDSIVLAEEAGVPLLVRRAHGGGYVNFLAVDPGLEPFQSWVERGQFWFTMLTTSGQRPSWARGTTDLDAAMNAADFIKGLRLPDVVQLGGFLAIYILIVGPLNYLILQRLGRRELAWLTIPLIVIGASVIYYITGFNLRGTQAIVNRLAVVQVWPGSERGQVDSVIGVLAPRRGVYDLQVDNGMTLRALVPDSFGSFGPASTITIYEDGAYQARQFPVDAGTTAAFAASGYTEAVPVEGQAFIELSEGNRGGRPRGSTEANAPAARITGRVQNTTGQVLQDAVVLAMGGSFPLGTLNPGEVRDFQIEMTANVSPPVALGAGGWSSLYTSRAYRVSVNSRAPDRQGTVRDLMGNRFAYADYRSGTFESTTQRQEYRRRQLFLEAIALDTDPSGGRGTDVYLAGWTNTSPVGVSLNGALFETEDTTLYIYRLPVAVRPVSTSGIVELPNAYLNWTPTEQSSRRDAAPYELRLQPGDKLIFRYNPMPLVRLSDVTAIKLFVKPGNQLSNGRGEIGLWDWTAGRFEIFVLGNDLVLDINDRPERFVGPENSVELLVQPGAGDGNLYYERIDLTLYGRLENAAAPQPAAP